MRLFLAPPILELNATNFIITAESDQELTVSCMLNNPPQLDIIPNWVFTNGTVASNNNFLTLSIELFPTSTEFLCVVNSLNLQISFNYTIINAELVLSEIDSLNTTVNGSVSVELSDQLTAVAASVDSPDAATNVLNSFNNLLELTDPSTLDQDSATQLATNSLAASTSAVSVTTNGASQMVDNAVTNLFDQLTNVFNRLPVTVSEPISIRNEGTFVDSRVIQATSNEIPLSISTTDGTEPLNVTLPSNFLSANTRVTLIISDSTVGGTASLAASGDGIISSPIVSIGIPGVGRDTVIDPPIELNFPLNTPIDISTSEPLCVFWNEEQEIWDSTGVETRFVNGEVTCIASHLTTFSVVVVPTPPTPPTLSTLNLVLRIISYILLSLSLVALVISLILFIFSWKRFFEVELNRVYFNYAIALAITVSSLIFGVNIGVLDQVLCIIVSLWFHYSWLALFSWSLAIAILITYMLTFVFKSDALFWPLFAIAWGFPVPIVLITLIIGVIRGDYVQRDENCFLAVEYLWSLLGPILVIIVLNTIAYIICIIRLIMFAINKVGGDISSDLKRSLISGVILLPVLAMPWIVILLKSILANFVLDSPTYVWVFLLLNGPVGVVFLVVYTLPNKAVQHTIWTKILRKGKDDTESPKQATNPGIALEQVQPQPKSRDIVFSNRSVEGGEAIDVV